MKITPSCSVFSTQHTVWPEEEAQASVSKAWYGVSLRDSASRFLRPNGVLSKKETGLYSGYSLLELLLVLVIVSSILTWSVPAWQDFVEKNELESVTNDLSTLLRFARYYATNTGESVTLNALDGEDWSNGVVLFPDNSKHRYRTEMIHQYQWPPHHVQVKWQGFQSKQYLVFSSDQEEASLNGHFTLTTSKGKKRLLVLNRLGRMATA